MAGAWVGRVTVKLDTAVVSLIPFFAACLGGEYSTQKEADATLDLSSSTGSLSLAWQVALGARLKVDGCVGPAKMWKFFARR